MSLLSPTPMNQENVSYYLMWCIEVKSRLVWPYEDGKFTYQADEMVVMGHFFEKVKKQDDYIIYKYFMPQYISFQYNHLVIVVRISLT